MSFLDSNAFYFLELIGKGVWALLGQRIEEEERIRHLIERDKKISRYGKYTVEEITYGDGRVETTYYVNDDNSNDKPQLSSTKKVEKNSLSEEDEYYLMKGKIVECLKSIEWYLRNIGANGNGAKELLLNVKNNLPQPIFNSINRCIHIRNKAVHGKFKITHSELQEYKICLIQIRYYFDPNNERIETEVISKFLD